jgi:amino acid adenylation domain-containing protein
MSQLPSPTPSGVLQQQAIRAACMHPTSTFIAFAPEAIERSIPARFEQQVAHHPGRLAVKSKLQTLTYAALNSLANRVASAILAQQQEDGLAPIGLLCDQEALGIAALLGVLKAGKLAVPVDPSHPATRIRDIFADAQAKLIVTDTQYRPLANVVAQARTPVLDLGAIVSSPSVEDLALPLSPDTPAFLLYTSGSTGQPKGVAITNRHALHNIRQQTNVLRLCAEDRLALLRSYSVASGMRLTWSALLNGAALCTYKIEAEGLAPLALWLQQEGITMYDSSATVFRQFISTLTGEEQFPMLRLIRLGNEPVSTRDVALYQQHFARNCLLINAWGSTETGTICMYFVDMESQILGTHVPVGYPVEDVEVLLFDDNHQPVGGDCVGELAVRSRYLAAGYWRQPDLTRAAFLPNPAGGDARIYLSGDMGHLRPDGCLMHLGRRDGQVKVRGFRVELAEVEQALLTLTGIREAVVRIWEGQPEGQRLVAYVVPDDPLAQTASALRRALAERLPAAMIPATFVMLDALPLTASGKVDRQALPAPDGLRPELEAVYVAPSTEVEQRIAAVWREVLGVAQVGIHDNFFHLGGHSLTALQVIARLRRVFRVELSLRRLFEAPTVAELAQAIIAHETTPGQTEKIAHTLKRIEAMSAEDMTNMLQKKRAGQGEVINNAT